MENIKNMSNEQLKNWVRQAQIELTQRENLEREVRWANLQIALRKYLELGTINYVDEDGDSHCISTANLDLQTIGMISNADW